LYVVNQYSSFLGGTLNNSPPQLPKMPENALFSRGFFLGQCLRLLLGVAIPVASRHVSQRLRASNGKCPGAHVCSHPRGARRDAPRIRIDRELAGDRPAVSLRRADRRDPGRRKKNADRPVAVVRTARSANGDLIFWLRMLVRSESRIATMPPVD
jgi:hypothetical protein